MLALDIDQSTAMDVHTTLSECFQHLVHSFSNDFSLPDFKVIHPITGNPRYTRSHFTRFRYNAI
jgi:hypothetical protein